jgi:hypothetical protein
MDGTSGSSRDGVAASRKVSLTGNVSEPQDIFVRAHTSVRTKNQRDRRWVTKWPRHCLIFDTETTLDPLQTLNFGVYRRCELVGGKYLCVAEGIFYRDDLPKRELKLLQQYKINPRTLPPIEYFPAPTTLGLMSRSEFVRRIFWKSVRKGELIVGFNLPFDLSRLAVKWTEGKKGDWSLALSSLWKNPKTGRVAPNPKRPRIIVDSQNSKMAFLKLGSILHKKEWPREGRFLDLRTLGWALRNVAYSLNGACKAFHVEGKSDHKPSGRISDEESEYCRGDVAATNRLLNAMMGEFNQHPIELRPDKAFSPASIAKAYLAEMGIKQPKDHFRVPHKTLGIAMQSYYGGRAECRIRKTLVPVIHTDFTSQYPTVNTLLGNWNVLTASSVEFAPCTARVKKLLSAVTLLKTFDKQFWSELSFFALVKPQRDVLPVRTLYNDKSKNIGLNYLVSDKPIWYAGPDLVASKILTGRTPKILQAIRMVHDGRQSRLESTNLAGMVEIDPNKDDFYRKVIEQRICYQETDEPLANFLKVVANSGSYGLFVQVDTERKKKETKVRYFSGEKKGQIQSTYTEKPGPWYFPPIASLITAGGRLLLAMLEQSVEGKGGSYLFCDTDSLCIVGTETGGLVSCEGGKFQVNGKPAIKALSLNKVQEITARFRKLNPYDSSPVREILKIEKVNFVASASGKAFRQLFGYCISAKRYALFTKVGNEIHVEKASGHGLGYLFSPRKRKKEDETEDQETPLWVTEGWEYLLRKELGLPATEPTWLDLPASMRMVLTTPNVLKNRRPDWLGPFNFFLFPIISESLGGYPPGFDRSNFLFITPMEMNRKKWLNLKGINLCDGRTYQISMSGSAKQGKVGPDSFRIILNQYLRKPEVKSLAPDGTRCTGKTQGLLRRTTIIARQLIPVGKETDRRWEQGEDPSMIDASIYVYEAKGKMCIADPADRKRWSKIAVTKLITESSLSPTTVYKILEGEPVRCYILASFTNVANNITR